MNESDELEIESQINEILSHPCTHVQFCKRMFGYKNAILAIQNIKFFDCYCRRYEGQCPVGYGVPWIPLKDIADGLGWTIEETIEVAEGLEKKGLVDSRGADGGS